MTIVTVHQAKTKLSQLIAQAEQGEEIVIARGSIPAVRLVPVKPNGKRQFGALKGIIDVDDRAFDPLSDEELKDWGFD